MHDLLPALRYHGVRSPSLLSAFEQVDRALFVPEDSREEAYLDIPIPIPHSQVTSQPSLIATMIEALDLTGNEKVLEIGTGLGFQTALLATLSAEVHSVEWYPDLSRQASRNLARAGLFNARLIVGDGTLGLPRVAPFDAIVCAAATPEVPPPLAQQLKQGGRLVIPLGPGGAESVVLFRKDGGKLFLARHLTEASFVQMSGAWGAQRKKGIA